MPAPKPALCLLQNRLCADPKQTVPKLALCLLLNRLCACSKTGFVPVLNLPHQDRICADPKPAFSFWINILTVSELMCDCQGLGLVARIQASNLVFDTMQVLYWPVLRQIQFCSFDRRCKTCPDTKPVLYQGRFCSLTDGCHDVYDDDAHDIVIIWKMQLRFPNLLRWMIMANPLITTWLVIKIIDPPATCCVV